ncbi:MAG: hypothetical protein ABR553_05890 [Gammaproteobacteria bacterium]
MMQSIPLQCNAPDTSMRAGISARLQSSVRCLVSCLLLVCAASAAASGPHIHDSTRLSVSLDARTPQQIAAFYEARGFSRPMIELLRAQCYLTVFIHNKGADVLWLDLGHWRFADAEGAVERLDRGFWQRRWQDMAIPAAHRATFRWTLLPERLDFRADEREGGNIILPRTGRPFTVSARFDTGADRSGVPIEITFNDVQCADTP